MADFWTTSTLQPLSAGARSPLDKLAASGVDAGSFATFQSFDPETRALVIRLLDSPTEADVADLRGLPHGKALAQRLLTLPAYRNAPDDDDDDDGPTAAVRR